ncbi:DUF438 domain-containing protein [Spirochaetota bacterium]
MSEFLQEDKAKIEQLKSIIDRLAQGASPSEVKKEFHDLIKEADAAEVAAMEQSLIDGGLPVEEVQRLCEVHADVFRAGLEKGIKADKMPGHPVHTFMAENKEAKRLSWALSRAAWLGAASIKSAAENLKPIIRHYERKENQLFPYLERTGFTGPSKVMWGKHDEIRNAFKLLDESLAASDSKLAKKQAKELAHKIRTMIFMEERILFPNALKRISEEEWAEIRRGEDAIGFAWVRPGAEWDPALVGRQKSSMYGNFEAAIAATSPVSGPENRDKAVQSELLNLAVGKLPLDYLNRILVSLPFDISFVDADNKVLYYSDSPHRVFPRSPGIIGRDVENCHPPKSVATVKKIIESFRNKEKDKAEFWLELGGKFIYISYKPMFDDSGKYLGTLEMSMDASELRSLQGQRRLLDW